MVERRRVFISHKSESADRRLAEHFKDHLVTLGFHDDEVFVAEEIPPGTEWREDIQKALVASHALLLLYTDPSHDWDWCLFECGVFAAKLVALRDPARYQLVCMNRGNARPAPISAWMDVATHDKLEELIQGWCKGNDHYEPVNAGAAMRENVLGTLAQDLWQEFMQITAPGEKPQWEETLKRRRILVYITSGGMKSIVEGGGIPVDSEVEVSDGAKEIFARAQPQQKWEQLVTCLDEVQRTWAGSLSTVIRMLNSKRTNSPMLPLVRGDVMQNGQAVLYRPAVIQRDELPGTLYRFHIEFVRSPDASGVTADDPADALYHWLLLARNFREGVLRIYERRFATVKTYEEAVEEMKNCTSEIDIATIEMQSRGLDIETSLRAVFQPAVRMFIEDLQSRWAVWKKAFDEHQERFAGHKGDLSPDDKNVLMGSLSDVLHLNQLFCALTAGAYQGQRLTT